MLLYKRDLFCPLGGYQLERTQRNLTSYSQKRQGDEEIYTPVHARGQSHGPSSDPTRENFTQDQPGHWNTRKKKCFFGRTAILAVNLGSPWIQVRPPERISWFSGVRFVRAHALQAACAAISITSGHRPFIPAWWVPEPVTGGTGLGRWALTAHLGMKASSDLITLEWHNTNGSGAANQSNLQPQMGTVCLCHLINQPATLRYACYSSSLSHINEIAEV